jgi:hypothetical protein
MPMGITFEGVIGKSPALLRVGGLAFSVHPLGLVGTPPASELPRALKENEPYAKPRDCFQ